MALEFYRIDSEKEIEKTNFSISKTIENNRKTPVTIDAPQMSSPSQRKRENAAK